MGNGEKRSRAWLHATVPLLGLLLAGGCGRRPSIPEQPLPQEAAKAAQSLEVGGSVIRMAAPEGDWRFEARSERAAAPTVHGPYVLTPMEGSYEAKGQPPVLMGADRAEVDTAAERVRLVGSVWVYFRGAQLEADRVEYDLGTGKVVAEGRTKWTFTDERLAPGEGKPEEGGRSR